MTDDRPPVSLTPATEEDLPAIVALMNRAYRGTGADAGWCTEDGYLAGDRTTLPLLRADLRARPQARLLKWAAPDDGALLGCVWLEPQAGGCWYLGSFVTEPARQNKGLGRALLAAAEDHVRAAGGTRIRLTVVNVREALIAWYRRRGYLHTGETEPFPYGDNRFGTPLRDDLAFTVLAKALSPAPIV